MRPTDTLYAELQNAFDVFNARLFDGQLPGCLITLQRRDARSFGYYSPARFGARVASVGNTDEIALNPLHFKSHGPLEALQTLAHEMAHMWQHHCGKPSRKGYHDRQWADKMEAIGLMPSSTGKPGGARTGQHMADYAIDGGLFLAVANELLAARFTLAWYDRAIEIMAEQQSQQLAAALVAIPAEVHTNTVSVNPTRSKVKFKCTATGCKAKAWGKPTLHLVCGEHGAKMERAI